jgi:16S rRNA (adenine1518-N6/adenine1519-N6)-dimethyltransferase
VKRVTPKKHLGQHFLNEENTALKIVNSLKTQTEALIEVGPGMGVLTQHLLGRQKFTAYDVDRESIHHLKERFPDHSAAFVEADFLKLDFSGESSVSIIGNFPYNISSQIFFKIYDHRDNVKEVVGMIQKEVADRIAADHGNKTYGILSVLLQVFFDIEYLFAVKPGAFNPPPKVMSAVIRLTRNSTDRLACDEKLFKRVVKAGFGKRRKTLRNALKELNLPVELTQDELFDQRAEQLSVQQFVTLTDRISKSWK